MYPDALLYPLRPNGLVMIISGAIFMVLLDIGQLAPLLGLFVAIIGLGYFAAFYLDIVATTMAGKDEIPQWPEVTSFWDDLFAPFCRVFVLALLSFTPLLALVLFGDHHADWYLGAYWAALSYGCFYFPMSVLASQAFGNVAAALPHIVFPAFWRAFPEYYFAVGALIIACVVSSDGQAAAHRVPYLGPFLASAVSIYVAMFQGRLLGLIYREKREALGWE